MKRGRMWRLLIALFVMLVPLAVQAQETETPTPPALVITVIVVPASPTPTYTPTETPTETPGPSPTPSPTPTSTPQSGLTWEQRDEETGSASSGSIAYTVTAGEFMIVVLLFALLSGQVIGWVLKMRGR